MPLKRLYFGVTFVLISLILFSLFSEKKLLFIMCCNKPDPSMNKLLVPPAEDSHRAGLLNFPNTWKNLCGDNNVPGMLPGPRPGEMLGLSSNPDLDLSSPIRAPLLDNPRKTCSITKENLCKANLKAMVKTMPASLYYKYSFNQCSPYNGSYCQCTNNYIPLPNAGKCQPNGWNEDVCPLKYRIKNSKMYSEAQRYMKCQF